jgi:hypothetical protein
MGITRLRRDMHVRLVIPDLIWPGEAEELKESLVVPALAQLASKGRRARVPGRSLEAWLLESFQVDFGDDLPAAPYSLLADGGAPGSDVWMRADPVHLHIARDELLVADALTFSLEREEAEALVESLNVHFRSDALTFYPLHPTRWYLRLPEATTFAPAPLALARGRALGTVMPLEPAAARWRTVMNDVQMLLHEHAVNAAREARGVQPVNALWLWGAGRLGAPKAREATRIFAADPLARGLALATHSSPLDVPANANTLTQGAREGVALVVLDTLRGPVAYGEAGAWREGLEAIERDWCVPLVEALKADRVDMVTVHAPCESATLNFETTRRDLRAFWRRLRPIEELV